jgi:structure-specific endonuclease subunit SLX1
MSSGVKKNGHPRRPRQSLTGILSNLHLLLRVPSFARWPLQLHFYAGDVHKAWQDWCKGVSEPLRPSIRVLTDLVPGADSSQGVECGKEAPRGIHALPLDYAPMRQYVDKARSIFTFEREGACAVCDWEMPAGEGLYAVCSNDGCEAVGHLDCWGQHFLKEGQDGDAMLPIDGRCPKCLGEVSWRDMVTELTLRERGQKEVEKLLKKRRGEKA